MPGIQTCEPWAAEVEHAKFNHYATRPAQLFFGFSFREDLANISYWLTCILCQFFQKGGVKEALGERELFNAVSGLSISADNEADFLAEVGLVTFHPAGNGVLDRVDKGNPELTLPSLPPKQN